MSGGERGRKFNGEVTGMWSSEWRIGVGRSEGSIRRQ
jgi:hypothetical protein